MKVLPDVDFTPKINAGMTAVSVWSNRRVSRSAGHISERERKNSVEEE
jgi:hypothetical protein